MGKYLIGFGALIGLAVALGCYWDSFGPIAGN
jgi:hypothetical protein